MLPVDLVNLIYRFSLKPRGFYEYLHGKRMYSRGYALSLASIEYGSEYFDLFSFLTSKTIKRDAKRISRYLRRLCTFGVKFEHMSPKQISRKYILMSNIPRERSWSIILEWM